MVDGEVCCVCLEAVYPTSVFVLPCNHSVCGKCIYRLPGRIEKCNGKIISSESPLCPMCRAPLPQISDLPQYLYASAGRLLKRVNIITSYFKDESLILFFFSLLSFETSLLFCLSLSLFEAVHLPFASEKRRVLCSYARSQVHLIMNFASQIRSLGGSNGENSYHNMMTPLSILIVSILLCEGNTDNCRLEAEKLLKKHSLVNMTLEMRLDILLTMADSFVHAKEYHKAIEAIAPEVDTLQSLNGFSHIRGKAFKCLTRCHFELGEYSKALHFGNLCVNSDRHGGKPAWLCIASNNQHFYPNVTQGFCHQR